MLWNDSLFSETREAQLGSMNTACQEGNLSIPVRCLSAQPAQQVWRRGILTLRDHDEIIEPLNLMTLET